MRLANGVDIHPNPGAYTEEQAGALWNYKLVEGKNLGVHNPQFAKHLLQTAIDALQ